MSQYPEENGWVEGDGDSGQKEKPASGKSRVAPESSEPTPKDGMDRVEPVFLVDAEVADVADGKKGKRQKKPGKPSSGGGLSTRKILLAMGGVFLLGGVGLGGFWYLHQPAGVEYQQPDQQASGGPRGYPAGGREMTMQHHSSGDAIPMDHGDQTPPMASTVSPKAPDSAGGSDEVSGISGIPMPSLSGVTASSGSAANAAASLPDLPPATGASGSASAVSSSVASSVAAPVTSGSAVPASASAPATSAVAPAAESSSGERKAALMKKLAQTRQELAQTEKELASLRASEKTQDAATPAPRVIYRTVVRTIYRNPPHPPAGKAPAPSGASGMPDGYRIVGGAGDRAVLRTPSGAFLTIQAGDRVDGRIVQSVRNGQVTW
ncbi:hypothetical protein AB4090_05160 [Acidithiobacillus sp. IBUN Pt1247-S3]|uniref:hypothetical protein n=1 Tax=Acidithiobacillus sp. IBUN Pt1247-S3 TaxID=3166642 RepID=UPI0034E52A0A